MNEDKESFREAMRKRRAQGEMVCLDCGGFSSSMTCYPCSTKVLENLSTQIPPTCRGEKCSMCGAQAYHKVEEEIMPSDPVPFRHPYTAYVCHDCFRKIMGPGVTNVGT